MSTPAWSILTVTRTPANAITLARAKSHLRIDHDDEDELVASVILAAISAVEAASRVSMVPATLEMRAPRFPLGAGYFALPRSPVRSITSIQYLDDDGELTTVDSSVYALDEAASPARVFRASSRASWPIVSACRPDAVRVRYLAGPATVADVQPDMVAAVLLTVGHLYENRQSVVTGTTATKIPAAVDAMIARHMIPNGELGIIDD